MILKEANITYIFHSSFMVETKNHILIFDYIKNNNLDINTLNNKLSYSTKKIYVFVTHSHDDHFDPDIFSLKELNSNIKFIISDDISIDKKIENLYYISQYNLLEFDNILIETYGTTDKGLSYFVETDGLNIYHSGDLNWWHWKNDERKARIKEEEDYKKEIDLLRDKVIDISFVPVDPRLEEYYYLSAEYFIDTIGPQLLIPMHFGDKIDITHQLNNKLIHKYSKSKIWEINAPLEVYNFSKDKE
ncbi:MBL fold metallo-hydrolase [Senegalia massiliensis]|nr:MBL fold metallo-hydrolase [Senegalia massiliensis]